ncbi:hypothetical protein, partial [Shimia sp.]|uniref:hypothetical protein n=1 Tax=Shimia sp. TaxID=1954381 RepID=UPI00356893F7
MATTATDLAATRSQTALRRVADRVALVGLLLMLLLAGGLLVAAPAGDPWSQGAIGAAALLAAGGAVWWVMRRRRARSAGLSTALGAMIARGPYCQALSNGSGRVLGTNQRPENEGRAVTVFFRDDLGEADRLMQSLLQKARESGAAGAERIVQGGRLTLHVAHLGRDLFHWQIQKQELSGATVAAKGVPRLPMLTV